jgi:hypothetical protein
MARTRRSAAPSGGRATSEQAALGPALRCVVQVVLLLARRQLHLDRSHVGSTVAVDDGREFVVYRESSSSAPSEGELLALAMWFRLRWVPPGARVRAFLFERESILNTVLYAGFAGYRTKLWTVNHQTNDYAGFYTWKGREQAERYTRYAMRMLGPISVPGSLGCHIDDNASPMWKVVRQDSERSDETSDTGRPGAGSRST